MNQYEQILSRALNAASDPKPRIITAYAEALVAGFNAKHPDKPIDVSGLRSELSRAPVALAKGLAETLPGLLSGQAAAYMNARQIVTVRDDMSHMEQAFVQGFAHLSLAIAAKRFRAEIRKTGPARQPA